MNKRIIGIILAISIIGMIITYFVIKDNVYYTYEQYTMFLTDHKLNNFFILDLYDWIRYVGVIGFAGVTIQSLYTSKMKYRKVYPIFSVSLLLINRFIFLPIMHLYNYTQSTEVFRTLLGESMIQTNPDLKEALGFASIIHEYLPVGNQVVITDSINTLVVLCVVYIIVVVLFGVIVSLLLPDTIKRVTEKRYEETWRPKHNRTNMQTDQDIPKIYSDAFDELDKK